MKIKTSEATPRQLDWLAAKIERKDYTAMSFRLGSMNLDQLQEEASSCGLEFESWWDSATLRSEILRQCEEFSPSTDWSQGGPIIERERIRIRFESECYWLFDKPTDAWLANYEGVGEWFGPTMLIAAMRCYVASKLGDGVEIPDELIGE